MPTSLVALLLLAPAVQPWELLRYAPPGGNSVLSIDVQGLLNSPRARRDGWDKLDHTEYLAGAVPLNPKVERVVAVKQFDPRRPAAPGGVALVPTTGPLDLAALATKLGGTAVTIGDQPAVQCPFGYWVPVSGNVLGAVWGGGGKQPVANWLRAARESERSTLNRTLTSTVADTAGRHHICLVVDVDDLIEPKAVAAAVAATESVKGADPANVQHLTAFLNGLTTVVLTANVGDRGLTARVAITSRAVPATVTPEQMRTFLAELLRRNGAELEDFATSTPTVRMRTFAFEFRLSDPELARITHLFLPPLPQTGDSAGIAIAPAGPTAEATGRYLRAVNRTIDDLRRRRPTVQGPLAEASAVWYDSAATSLMTTSVLGVDPLAVEYGLGTAYRLRSVADSLRGQPVKLAELEGQAYFFSQSQAMPMIWGGWNPWGMTHIETNIPQIEQKMAELIVGDAANREKVWQQIDSKRSDVRGALATKYGKDVEKAGR